MYLETPKFSVLENAEKWVGETLISCKDGEEKITVERAYGAKNVGYEIYVESRLFDKSPNYIKKRYILNLLGRIERVEAYCVISNKFYTSPLNHEWTYLPLVINNPYESLMRVFEDLENPPVRLDHLKDDYKLVDHIVGDVPYTGDNQGTGRVITDDAREFNAVLNGVRNATLKSFIN